MYFIASALYYEKGDSPRAMKFLDKTIRVAKEIGIPSRVYEYSLRYAFIYQKLGLYGNGIRCAESVTRAAFYDRSHQQHFYSLVALLELLVRVNSGRADQVLPLVVRASRNVQSQNRMGLYHRAIARYYSSKSSFDRALHEYEKAQQVFSAAGMVDEEAGASLAIASVLLSQMRFEEAHGVITDVRPTIERMESTEAQAESLIVDIRYSLAVGANDGEIRCQMGRCETLRQDIKDANISMDLDAALFDAAVFLGDFTRASLLFDRYYSQVRLIVSNLPQQYVSDYAKNPQLATVIERYRSLKKRGPGRR
jgi:tetratricopeptide (TPR) repeat protein